MTREFVLFLFLGTLRQYFYCSLFIMKRGKEVYCYNESTNENNRKLLIVSINKYRVHIGVRFFFKLLSLEVILNAKI